MRILSLAILAFGLSGCASLQHFDNKASTYVCANRTRLIASALAVGDNAAAAAIDAYCNEKDKI